MPDNKIKSKCRKTRIIEQTEMDIEIKGPSFHYNNGPFLTLFKNTALMLTEDKQLRPVDYKVLLNLMGHMTDDNSVHIDRGLFSKRLHIDSSTLCRSLSRMVEQRILCIDDKYSGIYRLPSNLCYYINNRICTMSQARSYSAMSTPLILDDTCTYGMLPIPTYGNDYVVKTFTPDGICLPMASSVNDEFEI